MPTYKLTAQKVLEVKQRIARGEKQCQIARLLEISQGTVSHIKNNHIWSEIDAIDVSQHSNYWSIQSPHFVETIKQLYLDGYSQYQIIPILKELISKMDFDVRPTAVHCHQPLIHNALRKGKVKARQSTERVPDETRALIYQLKQQGMTYLQLSKQFKLHVNTIYRLVKQFKLKKISTPPLDD